LSRNLSNDQVSRVEDILRQLDQAPGSKPSKNRRRAARINIRTSLEATVLCNTGNLRVTIYTRNISTAGIGFVGRRVWKVGERVALSFNLPEKPVKLVLCKITFCRYVRSGLYEAGAQFLECRVSPDDGKVPSEWTHSESHVAPPSKPQKEEPADESVLADAPRPLSSKDKTSPAR
jgi:hypothetical protein